MPDDLIVLRRVTKTYESAGGSPFFALKESDLKVNRGEFVAVVGKSGSGKSTLLNLIAGIDRPTSGEVQVDGTALHLLSENKLAVWRGRNAGVVFQFFQLLPTLTVLENVMLPMDFCRTVAASQRKERALSLLEEVGIADQANKLPATLSGGQQQRAAIARALAMSSFGLFVLLLSGILVVNLLTAMMAVQVRQIGVMKAIGGTRWQIARIYFGQALLLGIAAVVLALPLGIWGSRMLCRYMAIFLNFDINSFAVPVWVYLLVAAIGLVAPLLAAAWPVWKGSGVSVREALSDFGVSRNAFGTTAFDRALAGMGGITRPLLLAIRNSFRRRTRLALTLTTLVAGGIFFMAALNVRASLIYTLDRLFATRQFDLTVNLGALQSWEKVERAVRNTSGVARAEGWIASEAALVTAASASSPANEESHSITGLHESGGEENRRFNVIGLPAGTSLLKPEIIEGRNLQPGETEAVMVVNSALATAEAERLKVGSSVLLRIGSTQQSWRIVGIAREPFSPQVAYIPLAYFDQQDSHRGMVNNVRLALEQTDKDSINAVKTALDRTLAQEGVRAQSSSSLADSRYSFDQHMVMIYVFLIIMSCIVAGVGGLGLMTTMSLNVLERRREMGILRAVGAAPSVVWLIVAAEGVVIGVLSWAIAALLAWPLNQALGNLLIKVMFKSSMNFRFELVGAFIWFVVSLCLGAIASFLPAWQAARRPVREAIGYE